jgi:predicted DNA-binding transcriptional regulator AlpA
VKRELEERTEARIMKTDTTNDKLLDTRAAASLLGLNPDTLRNWRCQGVGPAFVRLGRAVRYRPTDVEAYVRSNLVVVTPERP